MFPEAKLEVVNALKAQGNVVAMLGDGVNDGPALKAAHIGVAMGNKGTEIAKNRHALVITNDDLEKLVVGIAAGRRIYANIKSGSVYYFYSYSYYTYGFFAFYSWAGYFLIFYPGSCYFS
jgi:Ca2+-transporting ATPase